MTPGRKRLLFAGYAPVHFLCFRPVHEFLRESGIVETYFTGGFRHKDENGVAHYRLDGFYEPFGVDERRVAPFEELRERPFDAVVCAHTSDAFFPEQYGKAVQVFHGVSFKNFAVRDKVLEYDFACVPGRYHAERFASQGILDRGECQFLMTGFPKLDLLNAARIERAFRLRRENLDPTRPTVLYAPTGGKHNSLDAMGEEVVRTIAEHGAWNLLVKPHDHPKKNVDWFERLAPYEGRRVRMVRDWDIVPYLGAADLLLTDASSVSMEYTLLDRPMVFLDVPKLFENVRKRGGALDLETYGRKIGSVCPGPEALVETIADALAHPDREGDLRRQAARHLFHEPGTASRNVADVILHALGLLPDLPPRIQRLSASPTA